MAKFVVTVHTDTGVQSYTMEGASVAQVSSVLKAQHKNDNFNATIEQVPQGLQPDQLPQLMSATAALLGCIIALAVADVQIRKWLKN